MKISWPQEKDGKNADIVTRVTEIPAGKTIELKPSGLHVMLMGLKAPLKATTSFKLTLTFEKAGEITIDVPVLQPGKALEQTH